MTRTEKMLADWKSGLTMTQIGEKHGVTQTRVSQILKATPGWVPNNRRAWTKERKQMAVDLYASGKTLEETADALGSTRRHVLAVLRSRGIKTRPSYRFGAGSDNPQWGGGENVDDDGYVLVHSPTHPARTQAGYVRKHRLVMEAHLGRYLTSEEVVHHKDDNPANNNLDNLQLFENNAAHLAATLKGKCPKWTPEGKRRIASGCHRGGEVTAAKRAS